GPAGEGEFQIGGTIGATADSFSAALDAKLQAAARTELASASTFAAADNFFNAQGQAVLRVTGPAFATATQLDPADATTTVIWYKGEDAANARATVKARIDDTADIRYGAQANESGTLALVRTLAVVSIQSFTDADPTSKGRF